MDWAELSALMHKQFSMYWRYYNYLTEHWYHCHGFPMVYANYKSMLLSPSLYVKKDSTQYIA